MQFRSSTPDLHNFYNSFLQKTGHSMPCFSYSFPHSREIKNIFFIFDLYPFIARSVFIWFYLPSSRARVRTLFIYTRSLHAAGPKQPLGYTLRLRLYTRSKAYTEANANNGHTASPIGSSYGSGRSGGPPVPVPGSPPPFIPVFIGRLGPLVYAGE